MRISLLPSISKIFEKVVYTCIYIYYFNISPTITCFMQLSMASELSALLNWLYLNWSIEYTDLDEKQLGPTYSYIFIDLSNVLTPFNIQFSSLN